MKKLACKDLGVDCPFAIEGETEEEVLEKFTKHAMDAHKEKTEQMMKEMGEEKAKELIKSKIKEE